MEGELRVKATQTLPHSYVVYDSFRPSKWKRTLWAIWLLGLLVAGGSFTFLGSLASSVRPEFQPKRLHFEVPTLERLCSISILVVALAALFAVHELIHILCLWGFTGERPVIVTGGGGLAVRLPSWYLSRNEFLVANLAPVCLITVAGLLLLPLVPQTSISLLVFLTAMNFAGSTPDMASSVYILLHPPSIYLDTEGTIYTDGPQGSESVPKWKQRIRSFIESTLAKLD